jgi:hypothetical protein
MTNFNRVILLKYLPFNRTTVDIGAIGTVKVLDRHLRTVLNQAGVPTTDRQVFEDDVVVGSPPQGGAIFGEIDFLGEVTVKSDGDFWHKISFKDS